MKRCSECKFCYIESEDKIKKARDRYDEYQKAITDQSFKIGWLTSFDKIHIEASNSAMLYAIWDELRTPKCTFNPEWVKVNDDHFCSHFEDRYIR